MPTIANYRGLIPAVACPFTKDHRIDEKALRRLASHLADQPGMVALMTNGHTGEVFSLLAEERAEVTRIVVDELQGKLPVISAIVCEGISEARRHARLARDAGAKGLDVMPPHHWLRFGLRHGHVLEYFEAIADESGLDSVVHVYPLWTKACYPTPTLVALAKMPSVQAFKSGQRDMSRYAADIRAIRATDPSKAILTCHDEYLLASMVQGIDGALVGFASLIPSLIHALWEAVKKGDMVEAQRVQDVITPLKEAVYGGGEPTGEAHARMKAGMYLAGLIDDATVRPPTQAPNADEMRALRDALAQAGMLKR